MMKKLFTITILFLALAVGFTACSKDDGDVFEDPSGTATITINAGELESVLLAEKLDGHKALRIKGKMNYVDFQTLKSYNKDLTYLNLADVEIVAYNKMDDMYKANMFYSSYLKDEERKDYNTVYHICFEKLNTIILPKKLIWIGGHVFSEHLSLEKIVMFDNVEYIESETCMSCPKLVEVRLSNKITEINKMLFYDCKSLKSIELPAGVTEIGEGAFKQSAIEQIEIPKNVARIARYAFWNCGSLKSITLPAGIKDIEMNLFMNCQSLTEINIPEGVQVIHEGAFNGTNIKTFSLPKSVEHIDAYSLSNVLNVIHFKNPVPASVRYIVSSVNIGLVNIYVPKGSKKLYQEHRYWMQANSIIEE